MVVQLQPLVFRKLVVQQSQGKGFRVEMLQRILHFSALEEVVRVKLVVMLMLSLTKAAMEYRAQSQDHPCIMEVVEEDIIMEHLLVFLTVGWAAAVVV